MRTFETTTKRLLVLSLGTILVIGSSLNAPAYASGAVPVPSRKPAAFRADTLALLRFPAFGELGPAADTAIAEEPPATLQKPPVPGQKPDVPAMVAEAPSGTPDIVPAVKPAIVATVAPPTETVAAERPQLLAAAAGPEKPDALKDAAAGTDKTAKNPAAFPDHPEQTRIYRSAKKRSAAQKDSVARLVSVIKEDISNGSPSRALKRLSGDKAVPYLDPIEKDQLQTLIARGYLLAGKIVQSYELASESAHRSGAYVPQAGWVAGLAAWRMGKYDDAARMFVNSASSGYGSAWQAAGSSYWASRSYMRAGQPEEVSVWLKNAARYPRTFYGLVATRTLGWDYDFNWDAPALTAAHRKTLEQNDIARQGVSLIKAGRIHEAEALLSGIDTARDPVLREALIALAARKNMPALGLRMAETHLYQSGDHYDSLLYPVISWKPKDGYTVDRALVHAIIRQESKFNPGAVSRSGAQGLMQVMPATASYISGKTHFKEKDHHAKLRDPQTNLALGQRYIEKLLYQDNVDTEMFSLVVAYNAGPGNLKRWKKELADIRHDPLLFIESIPVSETRAYVEHVMANYWIYRLRMNQSVPSLDAVAEGQWAQYVPADNVKQAGMPIPDLMRLATTN